MAPRLSARTLAADAYYAWLDRVWDPLGRRRLCPLLPALVTHPALTGLRVAHDLDRILRIVVGRRLTRFIVGDHPKRQSVTDFISRGAAQSARLLPYVRPDQALLEYGGGVGRLGRSIAPHVRRLVSVDVEPLMKQYGPVISPGVEFRDVKEVPDEPQFDGAYSVAVFFHLPTREQRKALEYVYRRLKPGGWFLVDLKIGPQTTPMMPELDNTAFTSIEDFRAAYEPWFTAEPVHLFYSGFLLRRNDTLEQAAMPGPTAGGRA
jgi:SAM-dependent methyltransferase